MCYPMGYEKTHFCASHNRRRAPAVGGGFALVRCLRPAPLPNSPGQRQRGTGPPDCPPPGLRRPDCPQRYLGFQPGWPGRSEPRLFPSPYHPRRLPWGAGRTTTGLATPVSPCLWPTYQSMDPGVGSRGELPARVDPTAGQWRDHSGHSGTPGGALAAGQSVDHQPRPRIYPKKGARDRLIRLATTQPDWALGFEDESWFSRLAQPSLHTWAEAGRPWRLVEQWVPKDDPEPKALACYGLLLPWQPSQEPRKEEVWLRFVEGRPVSGVTTVFLSWVCSKLEALGKKALLLVWDNASWHLSQEVKGWIKDHNRQVKRERRGVRILPCPLPTKSPWLNPIEPHWVHAKRKAVEADRLLAAGELAQRVCDQFGCQNEPHLVIPEKVS